MPNKFEKAIHALVALGVALPDLILYILKSENPYIWAWKDQLAQNARPLCASLIVNSPDGQQILWDVTGPVYRHEIKSLIGIRNKLHFAAANASANQISSFDLPQVAARMEGLAPHLWSLLGILLTKDPEDDSEPHSFEDDEYPESLEEALDDILNAKATPPLTDQQKAEQKRLAVLRVRRTVILSIMMQTPSQKANLLPGLFGLFLHSCNTSDRVTTSLARIGVSISKGSIYRMIGSLSRESVHTLQDLGQTLLVMYAADNFDVNIKHQLSTLERDGDKLHHLTSAVIIPLQHGVTLQDLRVSDLLWQASPLNPNNGGMTQPIQINPALWKEILLKIYSKSKTVSGGLTNREEFIQWKYLYDLLHHGPVYFRQFISLLKEPNPVEQIPIVKTPIYPARAMDCNNSTVSGNISALEQLATQGGIGDPSEYDGVRDVSGYVTIVHGDLGTGDRIASILLRRSIESTPWRRFQHIVFVPGHFHLKFACADAIYRLSLQKPEARRDPTSLMNDIGILHPKHTHTFASPKVTYRQMTNVINNAGIVRRLDGWLNEANRQDPTARYQDLEEFAASSPDWVKLCRMAESLARRINSENNVTAQRSRPFADQDRDEQHENSVLLMRYFLLYEELSYAMNHGDIGRVDQVLIPWIFIFKGVGKHKYALHMQHYLENIYIKYPEGLSRAIRYNVLVNPKGKRDTFRAVDWVVELMNLYTKTIYGGEGSNYTIDRILKESPLVMIYRDAHGVVEKNYILRKLTTSHSGPDMAASFKAALVALAKNRTQEFVPGRKSKHLIQDAIDVGRGQLSRATKSPFSGTGVDVGADTGEDSGMDFDVGMEDGNDLQLEAVDILSELI